MIAAVETIAIVWILVLMAVVVSVAHNHRTNR